MTAVAPGVSLGYRLLMARRNAGMEQADIATKVGVSQTTVSRWERDLAEPKPSQLRQVAEATDTPYTWLMGADPLNTGCLPAQGALLDADNEPMWDFATPTRVFSLMERQRQAS